MILATRDAIIVPTPSGQSKYDFTLFAPGAVSAVAIVLALLTVGLVFLRYRSRQTTGVGLEGDDWTIFAATFLAIALCALVISDAVIGSRSSDIDYIFNVVVPATSLGMAIAITVVYASILALIKISMVLLYKRIFTQRWLHNMVNISIVVVVGYWLFFVAAVSMFSCRLYQAYHGGRIRASWESTQAVLILDVILDAIILILPTPIIWQLKMSFGRKVQVLTMFAIGSLWTIASAFRLVFLTESVYTTSFEDNNTFRGAVQASFFLTMTATCIGIWDACLPALRPLIDRLLSKNPRFHSFLKSFAPSRLASWSRSKAERTTPQYVAASQERHKQTLDDSDSPLEFTATPSLHDKELPELPRTPSEVSYTSTEGRDIV